MCGIAGILWRVPKAWQSPLRRVPDAWTAAMLGAIAHRGPDGQGVLHLEFEREHDRLLIALLHHRLAIIDATGGAQPMQSDCTSRAIVFNGCIDNHRDLRSTLLARGYRFRSHHSDTEALLHAHAEWREHVCEHLMGSWAFAVACTRTRDVLLSQDFGIEKPLWWGRLRTSEASQQGTAPDVLAFASVPAALARVQREVEGRVHAAHAADLLAWVRHGAASTPVLSCAQPLKARGCVVSGLALLEHGLRAVHAAPLPARSDHDLTPGEAEHALRAAVALRMEADVPVGCFLSGGIDSSLIAAFAKPHAPQLSTFTVRMPDARYDESREAAAIARYLGTQHHELACEGDAASDLQRLISLLGAPFGDSSLLPTHWVARAARQHCKVCLTGDGGDELFVGYERHIAALHMPRVRDALLALRSMGAGSPRPGMHHPKGMRAKLSRLLRMAAGSYADAFALFSREQLRELFPAHASVIGGDDTAIEHPDLDFSAWTDPARHDFLHALPNDMLLKADHAAMAVALETRAPFLARGVQAAALSASLASLVASGGTPSMLRELLPRRKAMLRALASQHLPPWVANRPKMGFAIPLGAMLRTDRGLRELLEQLRTNGMKDLARVGLFIHAPALHAMIDTHLSGVQHHEQRLYALIVMQLWARVLESASMTAGRDARAQAAALA
jgi:asparagine synthase (glutamine-hydrolysing)